MFDTTYRLIGSELSDPSLRTKEMCWKFLEHLVSGSRTAQPPGSRPKALRVTTHRQKEALLVGQRKFYSFAEVLLVYSTAPANRVAIKGNLSVRSKKQTKTKTKKKSNKGKYTLATIVKTLWGWVLFTISDTRWEPRYITLADKGSWVGGCQLYF